MLYRGDNRIQTYSTKNHPCWVSSEVLASHSTTFQPDALSMESINFLRVSHSELDGWAERVFIVIRGRENVFCRLTGQLKSIGDVKRVLMVLTQFVTVQPYESNVRIQRCPI